MKKFGFTLSNCDKRVQISQNCGTTPSVRKSALPHSCSFAVNGSPVGVCNDFVILPPSCRPQLTRAGERGNLTNVVKDVNVRSTSQGEREHASFAKQIDMNLSLFTSHFSREGKRVAFTLAETLITLGIIGVVAAMTISVLTQKYQEIVLKNRAKKAYSTIYNAYTKTLADLDFDNTCFYDTGVPKVQSDCTTFYNALIKNLNVVKICNGNAIAGGCISEKLKGKDEVIRANNPNKSEEELDELVEYHRINCGFTKNNMKNYDAIVLNDGTTLILNMNNLGVKYFAVDTNGKAAPNKWGYDVFIVYANYENMQKFYLESGYSGCVTFEKGGKSFEDMIR